MGHQPILSVTPVFWQCPKVIRTYTFILPKPTSLTAQNAGALRCPLLMPAALTSVLPCPSVAGFALLVFGF